MPCHARERFGERLAFIISTVLRLPIKRWGCLTYNTTVLATETAILSRTGVSCKRKPAPQRVPAGVAGWSTTAAHAAGFPSASSASTPSANAQKGSWDSACSSACSIRRGQRGLGRGWQTRRPWKERGPAQPPSQTVLLHPASHLFSVGRLVDLQQQLLQALVLQGQHSGRVVGCAEWHSGEEGAAGVEGREAVGAAAAT